MSMAKLNYDEVAKELETAAKLKLGMGFLSMGKILYKIKQKEIFKLRDSGNSFSKFCMEFKLLPGEGKNKYLLAIKMIKIISELSIYRRLKDNKIIKLKFDKAYDLARFSQTHSEKDFKSMSEKALSNNFKKLRKLMLDQRAQVAKIETTTVSYDSEGKEIARNKREIKY